MKAGNETQDSFYHGRILVLQKTHGYRFALDAPLLADFIQTRKGDELLEWGTGNGIVSLLISFKPFRRITAVEIQPSLADLARRNVELNRLQKKIKVVEEDLRAFRSDKKFDVVFSNPPYHRRKGGHLSHSLEKSIAKHELKCTIFDIMQKTSEFLKGTGRAYFIFPEKRREDLLKAAEESGLRIRRVRSVRPRAGDPPSLVLTECDRISKKMIQSPDLVLYDKKGAYTPEASEIFAGRVHVSTS
jgi:tRNA1Val (adenine37-N6)-methyltransferase